MKRTSRSSVQHTPADTFVSSLLARPSAAAWPLTATLDITERCQLRCGHCFLGRRRHETGDTLALDKACACLDRLAAGGVLVLVLTGGEPLLHPQFRELWQRARRRGFLLTLFTNATLVDPSLAEFLAEHQPRRVEISVYGHTPAVYESVTGVPGSHARFLAGVQLLRGAGVRVSLKFPVLRENRAELEAVRAWAAGLGLPFRHDATVAAGMDGDPAPLAHRVPPEAAACLLNDPPESCATEDADPARMEKEPSHLFNCGAGIRTLHLDARGNLHPCLLWREARVPLLRTSPEAWAQRMAELRSHRRPAASACQDCRDRAACTVCPALSQRETGRAGEAVPYYCRLAACRTAASIRTAREDARPPFPVQNGPSLEVERPREPWRWLS